MPILIRNNALTNVEKDEVRKFLNNLIRKYQGTFPKPLYKKLILCIEKISDSKYDNVRELSIYLEAITKYLKLKTDTHFFETGEKRLLGALRYFIEVHDIIEDYIPERGLLDDIYCVNYAISKQSPMNKERIEHIANYLKKNR